MALRASPKGRNGAADDRIKSASDSQDRNVIGAYEPDSEYGSGCL
jgi:hypothetical protein